MNKHIKMVGLDLDGTLLTSKKELTAHTKEVIEKAIAQGCVVLVATGRPITAVSKELLVFPGMKYAVTANGARIINVETKEVLYENLVSMEKAGQVLDILADYDDIYEIIIDGQGYTKADCLRNVQNYFESPSMQEYMLTTRIPVDDVKGTMLEANSPVDKVHGIFRDLEELKEATERVEQISDIEITGAFSNTLEVNAKGVNKGYALVKLGEMLGINREEIMACGDGMNDYDMLREVGFGVAMANADERVKAIADYVTDTNDNEGVAKAFERFVLK